MSDVDLERLLSGIDAPRPMPTELTEALLAELTDPVARAVDGPRALPASLRLRLEASLVGARATPVPSSVSARILRELRRPRRVLPAAAAAVLLLVLNVLAIASLGGDDDRSRIASPPTSTSRPGAGHTTSSLLLPGGTGGTAASSAGSSGSGAASGGGSASPPPFTDDAAAPDAAATADGGASTGGGAPLRVALAGTGSSAQGGITAYVALLNAQGGIGGRPIELVGVEDTDALVTFNMGEAALSSPPTGVLFETLHAPESILRGAVASLASAVEHQARLAAASAFPSGEDGRAVVYVGTKEPWLTTVPDAIDDVLGPRGITVVRVPFDRRGVAAPGDAVFLSLPHVDVAGWLEAYGDTAPRLGVWGVGSSWDDDLAAAAAHADLRSLSPYAPSSGEEAAAFAAAGLDPSAAAVHGWVTGKAIAHLLYRNGGVAITEADLDLLVGWDTGWAPPIAFRPGSRSRLPDALVLRPDGERFVAAGPFLVDD